MGSVSFFSVYAKRLDKFGSLFNLRVRALATDASPEEVVPRSVPVQVAHELLQAGHRYLDVRY